MVVLVLVACAGVARAQDPWGRPSLTAVIQAPEGGAFMLVEPGASGGTYLRNGTPVTVLGPADATGLVRVSAAGGSGLVPASQLAAVPDAYMPSAGDPGLFLPVENPAPQNVALVIDLSSGVLRIQLIPGAGGFGAPAPSADGPIGLLGLRGGSGAPEPSGAVGPATPGGGANGAGTPGAAGGWQRAIIATAEESQMGASGVRVNARTPFVALPSRSVLRRSTTVQLCDAQGNGYGSALSAPVLDVGPWRTRDAYWETNARPAAESMKGQRVKWDRSRGGWFPSAKGRLKCNGAGIDLSVGLWQKLKPGMSTRQALNHTGTVSWTLGDGPRAD